MDAEWAAQDLLHCLRNLFFLAEHPHAQDEEGRVAGKVAQIGPWVLVDVLCVVDCNQGAVEGIQLRTLDDAAQEALEGFGALSGREAGHRPVSSKLKEERQVLFCFKQSQQWENTPIQHVNQTA